MKSAKYVYGGIFGLMITCFFIAFRALGAITGHDAETSGLGILFEGFVVFIAMTWLFGSIIGAVEDGLKEINTPRNPNCTCGCSANCLSNGMTSCTTCRADCTCSCKNAGAQLPDTSASRTDASARNGAGTSSDAGTRDAGTRDAATPAAPPAQSTTPTPASAGSRCGGKCGGNCKCKDRNKGAGSGSCPSE